MIIVPANSPISGYNLARSLRMRASAGGNLSRTPSVSGDRTKWSVIFAVKRGILGATSTQTIFCAATSSSDRHMIRFSGDVIQHVLVRSGSVIFDVNTVGSWVDPSNFYLIKIDYDTSQTAAADRAKITVNGFLQATTGTYPTLNYAAGYINSTFPHFIGTETANNYFDGYLSEFLFTDGINPANSSVYSTNAITGVTKLAKYAGAFGTQGAYLPFTDNSALTTSSNVGLGKDFSGNGNYWTTNNISITAGVTYDSMTDVPTLTSATAANFCVLSPLDNSSNGVQVVLSNANLDLSLGSGQGRATFSVSSGKWYWEMVSGSTNQGMYGIIKQSVPIGSATFSSPDGYFYWATNGQKFNNGSGTAYGSGLVGGDVLGIAFDADAGTLAYYKNGVSIGTAFTGLSGTFSPAFCQGNTSATATFNFGQRPFSYTPPSGYVAHNAYNLPDSTIPAGNKHFDVSLWNGSGAAQTISNVNFKPDFLWGKIRSGADQHFQLDSVRGVNKFLNSDSSGIEVTDATTLTSFNSDGFTLGTSTNLNRSGYTFAGFQWKAGQGVTNTNTNGTITSTTSVNAAAGFSIVTYTGNLTAGATVGHGLGVAPKLIIPKGRGAASSWPVYHASLGPTNWALLNSDQANTASVQEWNNTAPTSTVFSIGNSSANSNQNTTYVAYCWAEIPGFSKFGSYTGNGSSDGPFVYTGQRSRWLMIKNITTGGAGYDWVIIDTARETYNPEYLEIMADLSAAEANGGQGYDFLSNGFKIRGGGAKVNGSGQTYIYAAFAENPFKNSLAR